MRSRTDAARIRELMRALGEAATGPGAIYLVGGPVVFHHYDFYAQALAKIERGHTQDLHDAGEMVRRGLVEPTRLRELWQSIRPGLVRYPAIDPDAFREKVKAFLAEVTRA